MISIDDYTTGLEEPQREIATRLRAAIDAALPDAESRIYHSHPVWLDGKTPVAGFKAYPRYVTFMIWNAAPITDTTGVLTPGARMWTAKFSDPEQISAAAIVEWIAQARGVAEQGS